MSPELMMGLKAALEFNCNLLQAFCVITIVRPWFIHEPKNNFLIVIEYVMGWFYLPFQRVLTCLRLKEHLAPFLFLGVLIPVQILIMAYIGQKL